MTRALQYSLFQIVVRAWRTDEWTEILMSNIGFKFLGEKGEGSLHMFPGGQAYLCSAPIFCWVAFFCYVPVFVGQIYLYYVCVYWLENLPLLFLCFLLGWSIFFLTACITRLTVLHLYTISKGLAFTKALALHSNELFS